MNQSINHFRNKSLTLYKAIDREIDKDRQKRQRKVLKHNTCKYSPQPTRLTPSAPSTPCAMNIHDRQAAARSGRWRGDWSRRYTLCNDLRSQPKRPGELDLWPFDPDSGVRFTWAPSVPIGLSVLDLGPMYVTDIRQTSDVRQTSDKSIV